MSTPVPPRRRLAAVVVLALAAALAAVLWENGRHVAPGTWDFVAQSAWVVGAIFAGFAALVAGGVAWPERRLFGVLGGLVAVVAAGMVAVAVL